MGDLEKNGVSNPVDRSYGLIEFMILVDTIEYKILNYRDNIYTAPSLRSMSARRVFRAKSYLGD